MAYFMSLKMMTSIGKPYMPIMITQQLDTQDELQPMSSSVEIIGGQY